MSELLVAAKCCCKERPEGPTWFECFPMVEPQLFKNGFKPYTHGGGSSRYLVLLPTPEDYEDLEQIVFHGSCGQFWRVGAPVCTIQDYIDEGGEYIDPPGYNQEGETLEWGCGFEMPNDLRVRTGYIASPLPEIKNLANGETLHEVSGTTVTSLFSTSATNVGLNIIGNGNYLGENCVWSQTGIFNGDTVESEAIDITYVQQQTGRVYNIRYCLGYELYTSRTGGYGDEARGFQIKNPTADFWYNPGKFALENSNHDVVHISDGGSSGSVVCLRDCVLDPDGFNIYCCGPVEVQDWSCTLPPHRATFNGLIGSNLDIEPLPPGTYCPLNGELPNGNAGWFVYLAQSGIGSQPPTQVVQVGGPPTSKMVPQNGMGDVARVMDPLYWETEFIGQVKGPNPNFPQGPCWCEDGACARSVLGLRRWRVTPAQLLGESGPCGPADHVPYQNPYRFNNTTQQVEPTPISLGGPFGAIATNVHAPFDAFEMFTRQYGPADALQPGAFLNPDCTYSSGNHLSKYIGSPGSCSDGNGCGYTSGGGPDPWYPQATYTPKDISLGF